MSALTEKERQARREQSMVDIVVQILKKSGEPHSFEDLFNKVAEQKEFTEEEKQTMIARLFTEINVDGRFKSVGDNVWGLRSWYPVDTEEIFVIEVKKKKKRSSSDDDEPEPLDADPLEVGLDDDEELTEDDEDELDEIDEAFDDLELGDEDDDES